MRCEGTNDIGVTFGRCMAVFFQNSPAAAAAAFDTLDASFLGGASVDVGFFLRDWNTFPLLVLPSTRDRPNSE